MKNKFLSVLLSAAMIVLCFLIPSFAVDEISLATEIGRDFCDIEIPEGYRTSVDWKSVEQYILESVKTTPSKINLERFNISAASDVLEANRRYIQNIVFDTPKFLRVIKGYTLSGKSVGGNLIVSSISSISYRYTAEEYSKKLVLAQNAVDSLVFDLKDNENLSVEMKLLILHDRLCESAEYDHENYLNGTISEDSYNAFGVLENKIGVCQSYAHAFSWCLNELGIKNILCNSDKLNHIWNIVYINDKAFHIDTTWDDPVGDILGRVNHRDFLVSSETLLTSHNANDYNTEPSSKKYENEFWINSKSGVRYVNGKIYFINSNTNDIYCVDEKGENLRLAKAVSTPVWYVDGKPGSSWRGAFGRLSSRGNELVYSTRDSVYSYNVLTNESKLIVTPDNSQYGNGYYLYGMKLDGCNLVYTVSNNPSKTDENKNNFHDISYSYHDIKRSVVSPTCIKEGYTEYACSYCDYNLKDNKTEKLNHNYTVLLNEKIEPSCNEEGKEAVFKCVNCDDTIGGDLIEKIRHKYLDKVTKEPTCIETGIRTYTCSICGDTSEKIISATNHPDKYGTKGLSATCTEDGFTGGIFCPDCKIYLSGYEVLPATGHKYLEADTVKPTCTETGIRTCTCLVCGDTSKKIIPATNHPDKYGTKGFGATCTEDGFTGGMYCPDCKIYLSGHEVLSATGHKYIEVDTVNSTCTEQGYTLFICSNCNYSKKADFVSVIDHTDKNGDGSCDICGEKTSISCNCRCHKNDLLWRVLNFFCKIFKISSKKICQCGASHF